MFITVVLPIYNEENSIKSTVADVAAMMSSTRHEFEIVAVNDGSSDGSAKVLRSLRSIRVVSHPYKLGYGAALKSGIRAAKGDWIFISDVDGTYPVKEMRKLLAYVPEYDMVVGARRLFGSSMPLLRRPAKFIIGTLANFLTGRNIPDVNSGFRVFRKELALKYFHIIPSGFSFTTTITLAAFNDDWTVKYVPISYNKREGKSTIHPINDFVGFIVLIFRIVVYFKPLRFFLFPCLLLILLGLGHGAYQYYTNSNIGQFPVLLILAGIQIGFLGVLADLIIKQKKSMEN